MAIRFKVRIFTLTGEYADAVIITSVRTGNSFAFPGLDCESGINTARDIFKSAMGCLLGVIDFRVEKADKAIIEEINSAGKQHWSNWTYGNVVELDVWCKRHDYSSKYFGMENGHKCCNKCGVLKDKKLRAILDKYALEGVPCVVN